MATPSYVLMTAAHNEARFLPGTIRSVAAQHLPPSAWIIVSDGSTDDTDRIALEASREHPFIHFLRFDNPQPKSPYAIGEIAWRKVSALRAGLHHLGDISSEYLGNMDADITFSPDYYARLTSYMEADPEIVLGGGFVYNTDDGREWPFFINPNGVAGAVQFFRRSVFEQLGGYVPWGHEDSIIQIAIRMHGWKIRSFEDLRVLHHKLAKDKNSHPLKGEFHVGKMEAAMRFHPLHVGARCVATAARPPVVIGSAVRFCGYLWATAKGIRSELPDDIVAFNRREQLRSLRDRILRTNRAAPGESREA